MKDDDAYDRIKAVEVYTPQMNLKRVLTLNEISKISFENAKKRMINGGDVNISTLPMLKHTATEVVEATEAYIAYEFCSVDYSALRKSAFASELADIVCCCTIIARANDIDLDSAVVGCLEKNRKRAMEKGDKK